MKIPFRKKASGCGYFVVGLAFDGYALGGEPRNMVIYRDACGDPTDLHVMEASQFDQEFEHLVDGEPQRAIKFPSGYKTKIPSVLDIIASNERMVVEGYALPNVVITERDGSFRCKTEFAPYAVPVKGAADAVIGWVSKINEDGTCEMRINGGTFEANLIRGKMNPEISVGFAAAKDPTPVKHMFNGECIIDTGHWPNSGEAFRGMLAQLEKGIEEWANQEPKAQRIQADVRIEVTK